MSHAHFPFPQCDAAADHGEMRSVQNKLSRPSVSPSVATEMLFGILSHGDIDHSLRGAAATAAEWAMGVKLSYYAHAHPTPMPGKIDSSSDVRIAGTPRPS